MFRNEYNHWRLNKVVSTARFMFFSQIETYKDFHDMSCVTLNHARIYSNVEDDLRC